MYIYRCKIHKSYKSDKSGDDISGDDVSRGDTSNNLFNIETASLLIFLNKIGYNGLCRVDKKRIFNVLSAYKNIQFEKYLYCVRIIL